MKKSLRIDVDIEFSEKYSKAVKDIDTATGMKAVFWVPRVLNRIIDTFYDGNLDEFSKIIHNKK